MLKLGSLISSDVRLSLHTARVHEFGRLRRLEPCELETLKHGLRGGASGNAGSLLGRRSGKEKQPFHFGIQDDSLFAFAGLWDRWRNPTGTTIESCSILTTTPNALLADIHDRMPVILSAEDYDLWLDPGFRDVKTLAEVLMPFDAERVRRYPVSARVNAVMNDDPDCVAPSDGSLLAQENLFG